MGPGPQPDHRAQLSPDRLVKDTTACPPLPSSCPTCLGQGSPQFWKYHGGHTLLKCVARPVTFYVLYTPSQVCSHSMFSFAPSLSPLFGCVHLVFSLPPLPSILCPSILLHPLCLSSFSLPLPLTRERCSVRTFIHAQAWLGQREVPPPSP